MGSYIPSTPQQRQEMLKAIGLSSFRELYGDVPAEMYLDRPLNIPSGMSELEVGRTVRAMADTYGCDPSDIRAAVGPAIGPCCFETDGDVPAALRDALGAQVEPFISWNGQKYHIDLKSVNALWLQNAGVISIDICPDCTYCLPDLYWSHRRTGLRRGEQAAVICLKGEGTR